MWDKVPVYLICMVNAPHKIHNYDTLSRSRGSPYGFKFVMRTISRNSILPLVYVFFAMVPKKANMSKDQEKAENIHFVATSDICRMYALKMDAESENISWDTGTGSVSDNEELMR